MVYLALPVTFVLALFVTLSDLSEVSLFSDG